ncbi:MAG: hypothetical protein IJE22_08595 [Oscillibacter sp.]|nr:hypothetical protein [Oscillibacter sp.]
MRRKKFIKYLMANGIPRNKAVFYANMCGAEMPHRYMAAFALCRPDICEMMWWLWVRVRRTTTFPKARLDRRGQA